MKSIDVSDVGTFKPRDERERLLAAFAQTVAERGFEATTVETVAARAGVSGAVFERYFADLQDCFGQAFDALAEHCFTAMAESFVDTPGSWPEASFRAGEAFFRFCAGTPAFVYTLAVEFPHGGQPALERRKRAFEMFAEFAKPAFAESDPSLRPPGDERLFVQMIGGGVWEVFRTHAEEGRIEELLDAMPGVAYFTMAPLIGATEARRVIDEGLARRRAT